MSLTPRLPDAKYAAPLVTNLLRLVEENQEAFLGDLAQFKQFYPAPAGRLAEEVPRLQLLEVDSAFRFSADGEGVFETHVLTFEYVIDKEERLAPEREQPAQQVRVTAELFADSFAYARALDMIWRSSKSADLEPGYVPKKVKFLSLEVGRHKPPLWDGGDAHFVLYQQLVVTVEMFEGV